MEGKLRILSQEQEPPIRIKSRELTLLIYCMFLRDNQYYVNYNLYISSIVIFKIGSYNFLKFIEIKIYIPVTNIY